ncbi:CDP-6-deoxy-D-xylo-4-hexulose-3-dehydrase [Breznakibacter xylanolyticus]|uniref:CDP-6-deoxy-D-xylo-4-hexulose-3-dehydrase n=1 Tax=Breznakibacter xylanolyticus TaxID=990 RepID=A0A2W7NI98_9BACT|nr:lipopolysaccharide biosynthesis protein RfbH [Breznakibacter xylanolyticus]PZX19173.1 CDP-6-deoxy-D-xylo-4-hexulose-3-dehydrase [Breznakibacter xylanolyticus]
MSRDIRTEILELVKEFYQEQKVQQFIPGKTTIPFAGRIYDEDEIVKLVDSSLDFWLTTGRYAEEFEAKFAQIMHQRYCMLVNSGSSANLIAVSALFSPLLKSQRIQPGDEIITVAAGFPTTVTPIIQNGAVPVFVDVDLNTYNINASLIEQAITSKTKAIVLAHTLGNPFDIDTVKAICKQHNLFLVEDCCDAVGSTYNGKMVGTFGDIATTSFYPAHHITMGEGGSVLTSNPILKRIATSLRDWGRDCYCDPGCDNTCGRRFKGQYGDLPVGYDHKYVYSHLGYNLKVTDMQAAVGVAQLKKLAGFVQARKDNFNKLKSGLTRFQEFLSLPQATPKSDPSWFGFPFTVKVNPFFKRNDLANYLEDHKILTRQLFAGNMTRQPAFKDVNYRVASSLDVTDQIMSNTIFIGVYPGIDQQKMDYILDVFAEFFKIKTGI